MVTFRWSDEPELEGTWRSSSFCAELSADERERTRIKEILCELY